MIDFYNALHVSPRAYPVIGLLSPDKLLGLAQFAGLTDESRVIDFGCGYGESLRYLSEHLQITGIGIDILGKHIEQAKRLIAGHPAVERIEYVQANATEYPFAHASFDMAMCINASNMFGSPDEMPRNTVRHIKRAIKPDGYLLIAEPCYNENPVPDKLIAYEGPLVTESALLQIVRDEGFEVAGMVHSDITDWDRYISSNGFDSVSWLKENSGHPEWQQVLESHREFQDMYIRYRMRYQESVALLMTAL